MVDAEIMTIGQHDKRAAGWRRAEARDDGGAIDGNLEPVQALEVGRVAKLSTLFVCRRSAQVDDVGHGLLQLIKQARHAPSPLPIARPPRMRKGPRSGSGAGAFLILGGRR